jgi:hypothetical protein
MHISLALFSTTDIIIEVPPPSTLSFLSLRPLSFLALKIPLSSITIKMQMKMTGKLIVCNLDFQKRNQTKMKRLKSRECERIVLSLNSHSNINTFLFVERAIIVNLKNGN